MLNSHFKTTFSDVLNSSNNNTPLYRYLIISLIMAEEIEGGMDAFISDNKGYMPNSKDELDYNILPTLHNLNYPNSMRYQKLNICLNILQRKYKLELEIHLQQFLDDMLKKSYKNIYRFIRNLPPNTRFFDQFRDYVNKIKLYETEDEIFIYSGILIYLYSKQGFLQYPHVAERCEHITAIFEEWYYFRKVPILIFSKKDSLYKILSDAVSNSTHNLEVKELMKSDLVTKSCLQFFASLQTYSHVDYSEKSLKSFKNKLFGNKSNIQTRAFINFIFNFEKEIGVGPDEKSFFTIDHIMFDESLNLLFLESDLEALLSHTFLNQDNLNQLYLQQVIKGNIYNRRKPFKGTLNNDIENYTDGNTDLIRQDLLKNIISLCQIKQQKQVEEKYITLLFTSVNDLKSNFQSFEKESNLLLEDTLLTETIKARNLLESVNSKVQKYEHKMRSLSEENQLLQAKIKQQKETISVLREDLDDLTNKIFVSPDLEGEIEIDNGIVESLKIAVIGGDDGFRKKINSNFKEPITIEPDELHISLTPLLNCELIVFITLYNCHAQYFKVKTFLRKNNSLNKFIVLQNQPNLEILKEILANRYLDEN